ncbi:MAG: methyltransferase domain-containing protein [Verrucomicrobiota bacterium]|nr:methyltransferase domain-containing protein [Verrucomicrobiota bacterium]
MAEGAFSIFISEAKRGFNTTGAVLPSSPFLAREITKPFRSRTKPARILEVGPGTGVFTRLLVPDIKKNEYLKIVELNNAFVTHLSNRLEKDPEWLCKKDNVEIVCSAIENLNLEEKYDFIICALPFNNFPASTVRSIFRIFEQVCKPGAVISFFEYLALRDVKVRFSSPEEKLRLSSVALGTKRFLSKHKRSRNVVFLNFPPALVHHVRVNKKDSSHASKDIKA